MAGDKAEDLAQSMTDEHREILRRNVVNIVDNLILDEIFAAVLMRDRIITSNAKEHIDAQKTRSDKARYLVMQILPRRSDAAYRIFIEALIESRQDHLAKAIDEVLAEKYIDIRDRAEDNKEGSELKHPVQVSLSSVDFTCRSSFRLDLADDETWYKTLFDTNETQLKVEFKPLTQSRKGSILEMMQSKKAYEMKAEDGVFGRAIIINNVKYTTLNPRPGSDADSKHLEQLFSNLHFETEVHKNLKKEEMQNILMKERENELHAKYSMFVVCILAHGGSNTVYGVDEGDKDGKGNIASGAIDISDIIAWYSANNCPRLAGKPKLFFIQACQGGKEMLSVTMETRRLEDVTATSAFDDGQSRGDGQAVSMETGEAALSDANPEVTSQPQSVAETIAEPQHGGEDDKSEDLSQPLHIPDAADILIAYSTAPGFKSWRHPELGSWFIRCLVYVICNNVSEEHIFDILTQVAYIISHFKVRCGSIYAVQSPQIVSTLRKKVFFMP